MNIVQCLSKPYNVNVKAIVQENPNSIIYSLVFFGTLKKIFEIKLVVILHPIGTGALDAIFQVFLSCDITLCNK